MTLPVRVRKLIGTLVLLVFVFLYAMLIMTIAVSGHLPDNRFVEFVYFLVAGIAWAFPAILIIRWMQRPDGPEDAD